MSAYLTQIEKIADIAIAHAALSHWDPNTVKARDVLQSGDIQKLLDANLTSLRARYPDTKKDTAKQWTGCSRKELIDQAIDYVHHTMDDPMRNLKGKRELIQVIETVQEYIYQSCEYSGFFKSEAQTIALETSHRASTALIRNNLV